MKPVFQDKFGEKDGNCLQACVASIMEVPLESVPHFCLLAEGEGESRDWFQIFSDWCVEQEVGMIFIPAVYPVCIANVYAIASFDVKGSNIPHAVVVRCHYDAKRTGEGHAAWWYEIVHDPDPGSPFIRVIDFTVLIPSKKGTD